MDSGSAVVADATLQRFQIRELIERFFHALDTRNRDMFRNCFVHDATFSARVGTSEETTFHGAEELVASLWQLDRSYQQGSHVVANVAVELTSDRTARATTFVIANLFMNQLVVVRGTRLDDQVVHEPDGWFFQHRSHSVLWQYAAPAVIPPVVAAR